MLNFQTDVGKSVWEQNKDAQINFLLLRIEQTTTCTVKVSYCGTQTKLSLGSTRLWRFFTMS